MKLINAGNVDVFEYETISGKVPLGLRKDDAKVELYINDTLISKSDFIHEDQKYVYFNLGIFDLWRFAQKSDIISVMYDGNPLRMPSGNLFEHPMQNGKEDLDRLLLRFSEGQSFNSDGRIVKVTKDQDHAWQSAVLEMYKDVDQIIERITGSKSFIYSGTLLGYVRERGFIPHDKDMDCAYISRGSTPQDVQREFAELASTLIAAGYDVNPKASCISVRKTAGSAIMVDIAHLFLKDDGTIGFPFGTVDPSPVGIDFFEPVITGELAGFQVGLPASPASVASIVYGPEWMTPNPRFNWSRDRRRRDMETLMTRGDRSRISMDNHYSRKAAIYPSLFSSWLLAAQYSGDFEVAFDLGCGNGRDLLNLSLIADRAIGIDRSRYATTAAEKLIENANNCVVAQADLLEQGQLSKISDGYRKYNKPALFYARFLMSSITNDEESMLLDEVSKCSRKGDLLAIEARTSQDEKRAKYNLRSYRRYIVPQELAGSLRERGFELRHAEEGTGLAPYYREDPMVIRIIAERL